MNWKKIKTTQGDTACEKHEGIEGMIKIVNTSGQPFDDSFDIVAYTKEGCLLITQ